MAIDYAEKERIFVTELKADTGRDLEAWMNAITKANLPHRNDIIDWLRDQGFTFANASWLERIYANGGRLIYATSFDASDPTADNNVEPSPERPAAEIIAFTPPKKTPAALSAVPVEAPSSAPLARAHGPLPLDDQVEMLLAGAKGLRPLAQLVLREILRVLPETRISAEGPLISLSAPRRYLALLPAPKALRLYGDFAGTGGDRVTRAEAAMKVPGKLPPPFPAALSLDDARQIDSTFAEIVKTAVRRAHA